jgi:hypothetical protein
MENGSPIRSPMPGSWAKRLIGIRKMVSNNSLFTLVWFSFFSRKSKKEGARVKVNPAVSYSWSYEDKNSY